MRVKPFFEEEFRVLGVMNGDDCPSQDFILNGEKTTAAARQGLLKMLECVASNGLHSVPAAWFHEADKQNGIFEFTKGPLRLFFFKGEGKDIAVCTTGVRKTGQKADKHAVARAVAWRNEYFEAIKSQTLEVVENENK